ncbi:MAG: FAD-binding protein, partial [Thiohalospira sp.]
MRSPQIRYDVLIIGSGAAGLSAALRLPTHLQAPLGHVGLGEHTH